MASITAIANDFFAACETGKGWEVCKAYCAPNATFVAQAEPLADIKTLAEYADWMKGLMTIMPDGRYEVTLKVLAKKLKADPLGKETEAPLADWIDIGVQDGDGAPLFLEKKKIEQEETSFTVIVAKKPAKAGIDPYNKLIDRRPKDNAVNVEIE